MIKKISITFLISLILFLYNCQSPTSVVFEEGKLRKGMSRKDMGKALRFNLLTAHNPFKGRCFHEYYPLKKKEIISGSAHILTKIQSEIEPVFYILGNVTIPSHKAKALFGDNECSHGNGTLETWVKGHYEALDYISKN
tara:strand:+ start:176 stop:592 length:417 start_codon:yes stop_codon:yes gene_type:complete